MQQIGSKYDIAPQEFLRGRKMKAAAFAAPVVLTVIPAALFLALFVLFGSTPPVAFTIFFLGMIVTIAGFVAGLVISGILAYKHSVWTSAMRERIAADGIRADEIEWFRNELKPSEKRSLRLIESADVLLADAYRETLASRLTATRIVRSSRRELSETQRRKARIKNLKTENSKEFQLQISRDAEKIESIKKEAKEMLAEAETRLQVIEAAALRGSGLADSQLALKRLSARSKQLPLALEDAKAHEELVTKLESELNNDFEPGEKRDDLEESPNLT